MQQYPTSTDVTAAKSEILCGTTMTRPTAVERCVAKRELTTAHISATSKLLPEQFYFTRHIRVDKPHGYSQV